MCIRLRIPFGGYLPPWLIRLTKDSSQERARISRHRSRQRASAALRRPRLRGPRRLFVLSVLACMLTGIAAFLLVEVRFKPTLLELSEARAKIIATAAVNRALSEEIALEIKYEDLMAWKTDGQGNVVAVQPNTGEINRLAAVTTIRVQESLRLVQREKVRIPLGQVLGSQLLAAIGPWIAISILPVGTVNTTVMDYFETAGINQLRHRIYLDIEAYVRIVVPLVSSSVVVNTRMPIAEAIILGDVPRVYVAVDGSGVLKGLIDSGVGR